MSFAKVARFICLISFAAMITSLGPAPAIADGGMTVVELEGVEIAVTATEQRALLWLRDGTWELFIEPRFQRGQGAAAWIVPFPVKPTVMAANPDFLEHLDLITSPIFLDICVEPMCWCGCPGHADVAGAGASGTLKGGDSAVQVWERGTVGALEYLVLSTTDGDSLPDWLDAQGYALTTEMAAALLDFEAEDSYFFVARISEDADPASALAPVRFILDGLDAPLYPLRLTRTVVPEGETLRVTLWTAYSWDDRYWTPASHPWSKPDELLEEEAAEGFFGPADYEETLEQYFEESENDGLACVYNQHMGNLPILMGGEAYPLADLPHYYGDELYLDPTELGVEVPDEWSDEVLEIIEDRLLLTRWEARLDSEALEKDLVFETKGETGENHIRSWGGVYVAHWEYCFECDPCDCSGGDLGGTGGDSGGTGKAAGCASTGAPHVSPWGLLLLLGLLAMLVLVRLRHSAG